MIRLFRARRLPLVWLLAIAPSVVRAQAPSAAPAQAPSTAPAQWRGNVELTVGGPDADESSSFGRVSGVAVDRNGRIFVADAQDNQIRMFSPAGALVSRIGRKGAGPMEFDRLAVIAFGADGSLWVRDEGNARMQAIDVTPAQPRMNAVVPLKGLTGGSRTAITFEADGALVDESIFFDAKLGSFRPLRRKIGVTGDVLRVDTLPVPEGAFAGVHKISQVQKDKAGKQIGVSQNYVWQPYGPEWIRAYGPGGIRADVVTSEYLVRVIDAAGKLVRTIRRTVPPVPLSARERRRSDSTVAAQTTRLPFGTPKAKAMIRQVAWSTNGHLWVERTVADGRPRAADVFDPYGRHVATAEWPADLDLLRANPVIVGQSVTAAVYDADDVQRIVRVRFR